MPPSTVSVARRRHSGTSLGSERQPTDGVPDTCAAVDIMAGDSMNSAGTQLSSLDTDTAEPRARVLGQDEELATAAGEGPVANSANTGPARQHLPEGTPAPAPIAPAKPGPTRELA